MIPAFHGQQLEASEEGAIERVVVVDGDAWGPVEVLLEIHVATEDLHAQEGEDEEKKEEQKGQIDERVH